LGYLLLHLWWERHGAHGSERVDGLLYVMVVVEVWVVCMMVVVMGQWPGLWLRVWSRLWYGSEWVRLEWTRWERCLRWPKGIRIWRGGRGAWAW
jgi:hypothetical protein